MAQAQTVSLSQFTKAVHAAVNAAVQKHPKFKFATPPEIAFSYLIRGIPPAAEIAANVTVAEMQAFANEVAAHLGGAQAGAVAAKSAAPLEGVIYSAGRHIIIGIPPAEFLVVKE